MWRALQKTWQRHRVRTSPAAALFAEDDGALVSIDCETTSLNVREAELLAIAAVRINGKRIETSQAFHVLVRPQQRPNGNSVRVHGLRPRDVAQGLPPEVALQQLLDFIGGRTLVGYYLEYDVAVLNKYLLPMIGVRLPNREIEISGRYYDWCFKQYPDSYIDLSWRALTHTLNVPALPRHDAMNDAISVAAMYLALQARSRLGE